MPDSKLRVLFVCTGNICRSPMAEGLFRAALTEDQASAGWLVDSAGTGAGSGHPPEPTAVSVATRYGADISSLRSRPFEAPDFERFDHIVVMDRGHLDLLTAICSQHFTGTINLLPSSAGKRLIEVPDPYGGPRRGYEKAGKLIVEGTGELLQQISQRAR